MTLVDAQGLIRRANRRACELIAAKSEEVVGSSLVSYLAQPGVKEFEGLYHLARSSQAVAAIDGELKTGFSVRLNFRVRPRQFDV